MASSETIKKRLGIGRGLNVAAADDARSRLMAIPVAGPSSEREAAWIMLESDTTRSVVESWIGVSHICFESAMLIDRQNESNVARAAAWLQKTTTDDLGDHLKGYGLLEMKPMTGPWWLAFSRPPLDVVLLTLGHWNKNNGCFLGDLEMMAGEDIILRGGQPVLLPGTGGGVVVMIFLQFPDSQPSSEPPH